MPTYCHMACATRGETWVRKGARKSKNTNVRSLHAFLRRIKYAPWALDSGWGGFTLNAKTSQRGPCRLNKRETRSAFILTGVSSEPASSSSTQRDKSRFCPNCRPLYDTWKHRYGTWNNGFPSGEGKATEKVEGGWADGQKGPVWEYGQETPSG